MSWWLWPVLIVGAAVFFLIVKGEKMLLRCTRVREPRPDLTLVSIR